MAKKTYENNQKLLKQNESKLKSEEKLTLQIERLKKEIRSEELKYLDAKERSDDQEMKSFKKRIMFKNFQLKLKEKRLKKFKE